MLMALDIFGVNYSFEESGKRVFKTKIGGLLTAFSFLLVATFTFIFGKELYERKKPSVLTAMEIIPTSRIKMSDIPLFFVFVSNNGSPLHDIEKIVDVETVRFDVSDTLEVSFNKYGGLVPCKADFFPNFKKEAEEMITTFTVSHPSFKCLNITDNLYIQNGWGEKNASHIDLEFRYCDKTKRECHPDLDNIVSNFIISARYLTSYVESKDYSNPIIYYDTSYTQAVNKLLYKRNYLRFAINLLETDVGWFLQDARFETFISYSNSISDINLSFDRLMFNMSFESPALRTHTTRSYLKIQELFAQFGGLFSGLTVLIRFLITNYVHFEYYKIILEVALEINEASNLKDDKIQVLKQPAVNNSSKLQLQKSKTKVERNTISQFKNNANNVGSFSLESYSTKLLIDNYYKKYYSSYLSNFKMILCCKKDNILIPQKLISFSSYIKSTRRNLEEKNEFK